MHKTEIILENLSPIMNTTDSATVVSRLVHQRNDSPDGFFAAFLTLLTSGHKSIVHLSLLLLHCITSAIISRMLDEPNNETRLIQIHPEGSVLQIVFEQVLPQHEVLSGCKSSKTLMKQPTSFLSLLVILLHYSLCKTQGQ
ncbi:hypothetical protein BLNAU_20328 [Blattamonas nauphoetae]|uniref:Uncharacterized protein n=1 Tax=Blattamonas nauphoetae TaxID=2049346 RepID=A0ABQ9WZJ9_9EUKA|nr:hypothetical protein BLNAU_20328 [Blattamonas nauphoetae]